MSDKVYFLLTALIFTVVALGHVTRIVLGWEVTIGGWSLPMSMSWVGLVVTGGLAAFGVALARRSRHRSR